MTNAISQAAHELAQRRIQQISSDRLAPEVRPTSIAQALEIQAEVSNILHQQTGETIAGWKCLLPPTDKCIVGPIYASSTLSAAPCTLQPLDDMAAIEPEIAFVFAHALPPQTDAYTLEDVKAAIASTHLAFELIKSRYSQPDSCEFPELLADGLFNQGLYIGPAIEAEAPANCTIRVDTSAGTEVFAGKHPNEDALAPVVWLVNFLSSQGITLEQGAAVITGSYAGVIKVPFDEQVKVHYEGLGTITTQFADSTAQVR